MRKASAGDDYRHNKSSQGVLLITRVGHPGDKAEKMKMQDTQGISSTFEQELERLESIVTRLEKGGLPLNESISLFEEGQKLLSSCKSKLEKAQVKVQKLLDNQKTQEIDPLELGK